MEWTNDLIFEFLNLYLNEPVLWNTTIPAHKNKNDYHDAWKRIQSQICDGNILLEELKKKKDNLMSTYRRLRVKVNSSQTARDGTGDVLKPDWPFYSLMSSVLDQLPLKTKKVEDIELPEESLKKAVKRRHGNNGEEDKVDEPKKRMDEVHDYLKNIAQNSQEDECSLYTDLLCKKLRSLKESARDKAMLEIDKYIYNLKQHDSLQDQSPQDPVQPNVLPSYQLTVSPHLSPQEQFISQLKSSPQSHHSESNSSSGYEVASKFEPKPVYSSEAEVIPRVLPIYFPQASPDEHT